MEPEYASLADAMDLFAAFLARHGEQQWSAWVGADVVRVRAGDYYGVEHFLSAFGGMGSINDFFYPERAGVSMDGVEAERAKLAEQAFALADGIRRRQGRMPRNGT